MCGHPTPGNYAVIAGVATGCGILSAAIALVVVHFVLRFKRQQQGNGYSLAGKRDYLVISTNILSSFHVNLYLMPITTIDAIFLKSSN